MSNPFNVAIGWLMKFCYNLTNNYALALLLFAVFAQLLFALFGIKQQKNSQKQSLLRPKEIAIRKKYGNSKDLETQKKMQDELNKMYQEHGYNPLSGCFPMLLTLLIIFPLYGAIRNPLTYISDIDAVSINRLYGIAAKADEFNIPINEVDFEIVEPQLDENGLANDVPTSEVSANVPINTDDSDEQQSFKDLYKVYQKKGQIGLAGIIGDDENTFTDEQLEAVGIDTSKFDRKQLNFDLFAGISLLEQPSFDNWKLLFIPILVFATSLLSQLIISKWTQVPQIGPDGKETKMPGGTFMRWGMPLMSAVFSMSFNAAIGLYWIYGNILRIGQSYIMSRIIPLKKWTKEELDAAVKEYTKKSKKKKVIMIEVDEDDDSFKQYEISPAKAKKKSKRSSEIEAEALRKAKELDKELEEKAAEIAKNVKYKEDNDTNTTNNSKKNKKKK